MEIDNWKHNYLCFLPILRHTSFPSGTWFPRAQNGWGEHKCLFDAVGIVLGHWLMQRSRGFDIYRRGMVSYVLPVLRTASIW